MMRFHQTLLVCLLAGNAFAQSDQHLNFDSPEAWALKYFTSATLMSGLAPPIPRLEQRHTGSITFGLEAGWMPRLNAERARVGFTGQKQEDLNKIPGLARPMV